MLASVGVEVWVYIAEPFRRDKTLARMDGENRQWLNSRVGFGMVMNKLMMDRELSGINSGTEGCTQVGQV
jgi:hypothetical protein